ncbi:MAG: hypothetical protein ABJ383_11530, partial [Balneola sp.]
MGIFDNKYLAITLGDFEFDYIKKNTGTGATLNPADETTISIIRGSDGNTFSLTPDLLKSFLKDLAGNDFSELSISLDDLMIADSGMGSVFSGNFNTEIDLSKAPIIKDFIPAGDAFSISKTELLFCLNAFQSAGITTVNTLLPEGVTKLPKTIKKGFSGNVRFKLGTDEYILGSDGTVYNVNSNTKLNGTSISHAPPSKSPISKKLGSIGIQGIGLHLKNGKLQLTIN